MTEPLLSVRDLSVTYRSSRGPVPTVRTFSFDLAAGETLGVAGESWLWQVDHGDGAAAPASARHQGHRHRDARRGRTCWR